MRPLTGLFLGVTGLTLLGCASPPEMPHPEPTVTIGLRDAMMQTVDALAATRAHAARQGQRGLRACAAEAVFHVMAVPATGAGGVPVAHLVLAPPDAHEGLHSSTVTLTLAGDACDEPEPRGRR